MNLFLKFWKVLLEAIMTFAKLEGSNLKEELVGDAVKILESAKDDIKRWISLYIRGDITSDELKWLINGQSDLCQILYLKYKGVSKAEMKTFLTSLIEIISSTIIKMFIPI